MGVSRGGIKELEPATWKTWAWTAVLLLAAAVFAKGCFMAGKDMQEANDRCCKARSCTWLFRGNCGPDRY